MRDRNSTRTASLRSVRMSEPVHQRRRVLRTGPVKAMQHRLTAAAYDPERFAGHLQGVTTKASVRSPVHELCAFAR